jgi:hypothetical protein
MNGKKIVLALLAAACLIGCGSNGLLALESKSVAVAVPDYAHLSIGCGYGIHYGGVGVSFEFNPRLPEKFGTSIHNYLSIGLGCGYMPGGGLAYSFGLRLYPMGRDQLLQPRLSVSYGVVAVADEYYAGDEARVEGGAFGAGFLVKLGESFSLDGDAQLIVPVDYRMDELKGGRFRFSAGVRYHL